MKTIETEKGRRTVWPEAPEDDYMTQQAFAFAYQNPQIHNPEESLEELQKRANKASLGSMAGSMALESASQ